MKSVFRRIIILGLTLIYLMTSLGPVGPAAQQAMAFARAGVAECAGDCDICGCSPERRAIHTCCCWLKKNKAQMERTGIPECCKKKKKHRMTMLTCGCPCGRKNSNDQEDNEITEHLPYLFCKGVTIIAEDVLYSTLKSLAADQLREPPDPPPKLSILL